jgi:hypothetical protein
MARGFLTLLLFLCTWMPSASPQTIQSGPTQETISAAESAFPEYDNGQSFEQILKSFDQPWNESMLGGSVERPIVISRTFDSRPNGSVCCSSSKYPSPLIARLVDRSDFVGIGVPLKSWSYPTTEKSFAVTIYLVRVTSVTIPGTDSIASDRYVYIVRAGGVFQYDGKFFDAVDPDFPLLALNQPYLFFAGRILPGVYKVDAHETLKVDGSSVVETSLAHPNLEYYRRNGIDAILSETLVAAKQSGTRGRRP